jgi:guanosine-diphosphatase
MHFLQILCTLTVLSWILTISASSASKLLKIDNYAVVIDAGSTGSRCFVFRVTVDEDDNRNVTSYSCGKVMPGLSSFQHFPGDASGYLAPLLINAANLIPLGKQPTTIVHIKATAGMRLLSEDVQKRIWKSLVYGLNYRMDVPFLISKVHVGTIDGHAEAYFAVLASNYIAGCIDGNLQ